MRRPAWGGRPPASDDEARERILEAASRAVLRDGIEGTSVASIAREAGITRQTFYRYFDDGDEVLQNAELRSGGGLVKALLAHVLAFEGLEERLVESAFFLAREVPKDPLLARHFEADRVGALMGDATIDYATKFLRGIWTDEHPPLSKAQAQALAELMVRIVFSLVVLPREGRDLRRFLRATVGPAVRGVLVHHAR